MNSNVWRAAGPASEAHEPPRALTESPRQDTQPDVSPDGRRVAFAASRKSGLTIRVCGADGAGCFDFESASDLSRPRWSPDGQSLAVVGWQGDEPLDIYRLEIEGRFVRRLTTDNAIDTMPTWSADGRWLYFASDRSGRFEIWKMPSGGGEARQLTRGGGLSAFETEDGRWAYFSNAGDLGSVWRMPADGGDAALVLDQPIHFGKWTLWRDRVVYVDASGAGPHRMMMFDPATRRTTQMFALGRPSGSGIAVSPDGAWILYTQRDDATSDILVLEGLE